MIRGPVYVNAVVSYSLAYNATDLMDNDDLATALSAQIQISITLIGMVKKPPVEPIVLAKDGALLLRKLRRIYKPQCRERFRLCSILHCKDNSE